ncbi:MAG: RNA ligase family protein [Acidobacteriota bacterium]
MIKFTHIEGFHYIIRTLEKMADHPEIPTYRLGTPVTFRGTIKLHGSNSGVLCTTDALVPQSRNRPLSIEEDNYGFAAWVAREEVRHAIRDIEQQVRQTAELDVDTPLVLFGELIGSGIQKGVATSRLSARQWVLFGAATRGEANSHGEAEKTYLDALPALGETYADIGLYSVLDIETWQLTIDFSSRQSIEAGIEKANRIVDEVERACPWGRRFGIEGIGEGVVFTPTGEHWGRSWLYWKAKGEAHKKVKGPKVAIDPAVAASIDGFVDLAVTEGRLEQGLEYLAEMGLAVEMRSTGPYLQWLGRDVKRECRAELEASGLEWKQVAKAVNHKALAFFKAKAQAL